MNKILKYNQAKYAILDMIARGHLQVGDQLPGLHAMCSMFPVSEICVRRALDDLAAEGYIVKRRGAGTFLAKPLGAVENRGTMLFLEIDPVSAFIPPGVTTLKQFLQDRKILLKTLSCSRPDGDLVNDARECIGIFASGYLTKEWVDFLSTLSKPVLYIGTNEATMAKPCVGFSWKKAVRLAMERLVKQGARRIALINGDDKWYPAHLIAEAYLEEARRHGLSLDEQDILWKTTFSSTELRRFMTAGRDYDAFLVERGALNHLLLISRQTGAASGATLAVLGPMQDHPSTDEVFFLDFEDDIYVEAGKAFFSSLNDLDYFKNGPRLLEPRFVPGASSHTKRTV